METRQNIKEEEAWIRSLIKDLSKQTPAVRAWNRMMDYFLTNDYLDGNHHVQTIVYIYQTNCYRNETIYCFAWKNYIGERTLYRYRKKYILCFKRYYEEECGNEEEKQGGVFYIGNGRF